MVGIHLNLCLNEGQNKYIDLDVNDTDKIEVIRTEAAKQSNISPTEIILVFCGTLLHDSETVKESGLVAGDAVHCLQTKAPRIDEATPLTTLEAHELHRDLTHLMRSRSRHAFLQSLSQGDLTGSAISAVAGAWRDPEAMLLLQDTAMINNFYRSTPELLCEVSSERPVLGRLLQHVLHQYRSQGKLSPPAAAAATTADPPPPSAFSLDALYEQEEDDQHMPRPRSGDGGGSSAEGGLPVPHRLPAITPAQLAAALANATGGGRGPPHLPSLQPPHRGGQLSGEGFSFPATPSNTPASRASNTPSASHTPASAAASTPHQQHETFGIDGAGAGPSITSEMLHSALQSVLGAGEGSSPTPPSPTPDPSPAVIPNLEASVRLMSEMGIPDEALSRRALVMTGGDVQAAVEIVLAQLSVLD